MTMKRITARGILFHQNKLLLIHRIRTVNGIRKSYYVFPGSGLEPSESVSQCVRREIMEELGILVTPLNTLYRLETESLIEYFVLCSYVEGSIGTGTGPEFTSASYQGHGLYLPEAVPISQVAQLPLLEAVRNALVLDLARGCSLPDLPERYL